MELELNDELDVEALARKYAVKKRGQVRNFLKPQSAERLYRCLREETPWGMAYNNDPKVVELSNQEVRKMGQAERQQIYREVFERARDGYQYLYYYYPILSSYMSGENREFFLHRVLDFVNSPPVLEFVRKLTGIPDIIKGDGQATLYHRNTFLNLHYDKHTIEGWRCAYVINLTKDWNPNWGGYLQFFDENEDVGDAFIPLFNALNIFTVPQPHSVGYVPLFADGARFAITGWFRNK